MCLCRGFWPEASNSAVLSGDSKTTTINLVFFCFSFVFTSAKEVMVLTVFSGNVRLAFCKVS